MNKFSSIVFSGLISLSIAGAGIAAETTTAKPAAPSATTTKAAATEHRFRGSVTALDTKAGTLKVKSKSDEKSFLISDKVKSSFDKVKVGDRVKLTYADESGKLVIHALTDTKSGADSKASK